MPQVALQVRGRAGHSPVFAHQYKSRLLIFSRSALAGGPEKNFNLGPNPLSEALGLNFHVYVCHVVPIHLQILSRKKSTGDETWSVPVITQLKSSKYRQRPSMQGSYTKCTFNNERPLSRTGSVCAYLVADIANRFRYIQYCSAICTKRKGHQCKEHTRNAYVITNGPCPVQPQFVHIWFQILPTGFVTSNTAVPSVRNLHVNYNH